MASAVLFHLNGLAENSLWASMNWRIAVFRSATLVKAPRYNARLSSCANQPSTAFNQDALVGVKCNLKRGRFSSHCLIAAVLWVELLSRMTCRSSAGGVLRVETNAELTHVPTQDCPTSKSAQTLYRQCFSRNQTGSVTSRQLGQRRQRQQFSHSLGRFLPVK